MMDDRMREKFIFYISTFLFFLTPICKAEIQNNDLAVGVVVINVNNLTVSTTHKNIKDMSIFACPLNDKNLSRCLTISGAKFNEVKSSVDISDVIYGNDVYEFSLDETFLKESGFSVGMAFLYNKGFHPDINFIESKGVGDILVIMESKMLEIKGCNSSEGFHVYSSYPNEHLYYPYGYNVTETCSGEVYK